MTSQSFELPLRGQPLTIEAGDLAQQANGAVTVRYGDTVVLVTACVSPQLREGVDFIPLTVDYEERLYAAGKIPGGYIKREGRPSQDAILTMRLTDRSLRPLFPKGLRNDVQVIITILSADQENAPDVLAIIGASTALSISDIPWLGPASAVRVGYHDGEFLLNPTYPQLQESLLDLVVASTRDAVVMVEAGAKEVPEEVILKAIAFGHEANGRIIELQERLVQGCVKAKMEVKLVLPLTEVEEAVRTAVAEKLEAALYRGDKSEREKALELLEEEVLELLGEAYPEREIRAALDSRMRETVRARILREGIRPDSRDPTSIRPITCAVGLLPRTHGSGLFTRGQTQVLTIATLGSLGEEQHLDGLSPEESKRFMHHYNFPPFSTGEVRRLGIPSRREVGHGALAERALGPMIPDEKAFPYTIRLVSEVLSSNGSTSMASVCGSTLALMDAGVPVKAPVGGVAMGLVMGEEGRYTILTDIAGIEDAVGDMDFKVAGTTEGITALQMDIKVRGISEEIMAQALAQARTARLFILGKMLETISESRPELSRYAPRMQKITIDRDKIRLVIGPGGKTIRAIIEETKCSVDVEDDGTVLIGSPNVEAIEKAIAMIRHLTRDVELGGIYKGRVTRLMNFGAFVEILPGKEGLIHISELADRPVAAVEDEVQEGDEVEVMVTEIDRMGRINLSRRAVLLGVKSPQELALISRPVPREGSPPPRRPNGRPSSASSGFDRRPRPEYRPGGPRSFGRR